MNEGIFVDIDVKGVTDTKAGWTEILTGLGPEKTGVYSNGKYQPIPEGYTIFEKLTARYGKENIATVAVIGKDHHVGGIAPQQKIEITEKMLKNLSKKDNKKAKMIKKALKELKEKDKKVSVDGRNDGNKIIEENGKKYLIIPGEPYLLTYTKVDVWQKALNLNETVGKNALEMLEKYKDKPFFFFVHFAEVDSKGHKFGENSKEYNDAIVSDDSWTGKIIDKLKELKLYDNTLVYVTADHGFNEGETSHSNAPFIFLVTNDKSVKHGGTRADVTPTILNSLGFDLDAIKPSLDGKPLSK
jgi:predicted AlkP superfamily pyrophosphatase or phosphodiesterase